MKSERLKKLEIELKDLEEWLRLGLVPKKDIERHKDEIEQLKVKIKEEKERLQMIKESGDAPEYNAPRKNPQRAGFADNPTMTDLEIHDDSSGLTDVGIDVETETYDGDTTTLADDVREDEDEGYTQADEEEDEDPFSDKNRWKRGLLQQDDDQW